VEQNTHVHRSIIAIFIKTFLLIIFLSIGLYFGIRLGEGYYNFYQPTSPYYQNAVSQASHDSYNAGWDDGFRAGDDFETNRINKSSYNKGWNDGYDSCREENQSIRNEYDAGWDDGWEEGHIDGIADGYSEAYTEGYDAGYDACFDAVS
jgi:hypothetical protein